jgi:Zn-dependent M16 (insulinase) family peptidase
MLTSVRGSDRSEAWLFLRGKAVMTRAGDLLAILRDVLCTVRLDNRERFRQMVHEEKARLESRIPSSGSGVISQRLRAHFSEADWVGEQMGGVGSLFFLRDLVDRIDTDWPSVLARLEEIRGLLVNRDAMLCNVTLDAASWAHLAPEVSAFFASLPATPFNSGAWQRDMPMRAEGITIPGQVNYVGKAANLYEQGYVEHGSSLVALNHLNTTWLWEKVRKEGGAYGVGCSFDRLSGTIGFTSYRDPNLTKTLDNFDGSCRFLRELDLGEEALTRTIVGVIGDLDAYQLPDAKGFSSLVRWLNGTTDALRQRVRDEVLSTTLEQIHAFGEALEPVARHGLVGVVGPQSAIEAANGEHPGLFEIVKVL